MRPTGLRTAPVEWRVLTVVLPARIVPAQAKRADVALQCVSKSNVIRCRMSRIGQVKWLRVRGVDSHRRLGSHVNFTRSVHRPFRTVSLELDRRRFNTEERSDEPG